MAARRRLNHMSVPELLQLKRTAIKNGRYAFFARRHSIKKAADGDDQKSVAWFRGGSSKPIVFIGYVADRKLCWFVR
jgi:hypothetical protein